MGASPTHLAASLCSFIGLALFAVGSLMSGLSVSMPELIVFRGLMGLAGGGAIMTVTFTIIADAPPPLERCPKVMAFNTTSPGASPRLSDRCSPASSSARCWHWVFFVNVPLGVACFVIVVSSHHEVRRAGEHRTTDY